MAPLRVLLLSALLCCAVLCNLPRDEVLSLPGFSGPLPTRQYSGYLSPIDTLSKKIHYWFVESENDPKSDPVVLWLNGGPGCSSLESYFEELGPLHFNVSGDMLPELEIPTLAVNPYAWNKIVNVLFLESPVGTGFSYSTNPAVDLKMDDIQTARDHYGVLVAFFDAYSEYKQNDFYIAGMSYSGIYIPTLVQLITTLTEVFINLKGFLIGDGCIGTAVGPGACGNGPGLKIQMDFFHRHALISDEMYAEVVEECGDFTDINGMHCSEILSLASERIGNINVYNIYEPCVNTLPPDMASWLLKDVYLSQHPGGNYPGPDACIDDSVMHKYFDNPEVRKAIHVESISVTGSWRMCTDKISYESDIESLLPIYPDMIKFLRILIYNGDLDGYVPYIGAQTWTSGLNISLREPWHSWSVDNQVAGYVTEYDHDFKFVTVKGAGHSVPKDRPKQAYAMFERYIKNEKF